MGPCRAASRLWASGGPACTGVEGQTDDLALLSGRQSRRG
jgi:hypothetical protein